MATSLPAWLYQHIVAHTQDAVIFADGEGIIRLWNAGAETIFGYSAAEALGHSLDLIIPAPLRARHWEGYQRVMATGDTPYARQLLAVPGLRKDGTRISLEFTVVLIEETPGKVAGIAAVLRDVTARWQRDTAMQARLATESRPTRRPNSRRPRLCDRPVSQRPCGPMKTLDSAASATRGAGNMRWMPCVGCLFARWSRRVVQRLRARREDASRVVARRRPAGISDQYPTVPAGLFVSAVFAGRTRARPPVG